MARPAFPESYKDPQYASLDATTEQKLGLPVGLLSSVRAAGERSNHSQTNDLGTFSVYQFTPATRKAILDKYGLDVTLSPENASEGAGLLLKEGADRNKGDPAAAVGEYIGGLDRSNWGPTTKAYIGRVMASQGQAKTKALDNDFAKWMAANPATVPAPAAAQPGNASNAVPPPGSDQLSKDFGAWTATKNSPTISGDHPSVSRAGPPIGLDANGNQIYNNPDYAPPVAPEPSFTDKAIGAGEAALSTLTGLTSGAAGMAYGTVKGINDEIQSGQFGTPSHITQDAANQGAQALTYQPRTPIGQQYAGAVGDALSQALPVMPLTAEMGALGRAMPPAVQAVRDTANIGGAVARDAAVSAVQSVKSAPGRVVDAVTGVPRADPAPAPGTFASGGSAGADIAAQRVETAQSLRVPIDLTKGQAERSFEQQRFEQETAKDPNVGAPLRERQADTNARMIQNFDAFVDATGAEKTGLIETGRAVVDNALVKQAARDKAEIRVAYKEAEKSGEMMAPVDMGPLADYLNTNRAGRSSAPILSAIADELGVQEIGSGSLADGSVTAGNATLGQAESIRKAVNRFVKSNDPNDVRIASEIKSVIDGITEGQGGELYQKARSLRARYAQRYENRAIVADLLNTRKGTADRKVALEDVFNKTILNGSREDLSHLRAVLQTAGSEEGAQAWRELQGAAARHIRDKALGNVATDIHGNPIVSAAKLEAAIRELDTDGKLEFIFGKRGAQEWRDLSDIAKVVYTSPPGSVNTSNTASVILAAITEAGVTGGLTGLPVPVLSGLRAIAVHVKNRRIQQRVQDALNRAKQQNNIDIDGNKTLHRGSVKISDGPTVSPRDFSNDYKSPVNEPQGSRLAYDIEGRPLIAEHIAGRREPGGADVGITPAESARAAGSLGAKTAEVSAKEIGGDAGRYVRSRGASGEAERRILIRAGLDDKAAGQVFQHEFSHLVDDLVHGDGIQVAGIKKELQQVYHDLNAPFRSGKGKWTPENDGYKGELADRELIAEAMRAYMSNPSYFKQIAPNAAKRIRESVNKNSNINKVIQFNSVAVPIGIGFYLYLHDKSADSGEID